jgi:hypothetical protein
MVFRHALKKDFSKYRSNIIVQNGNSEAILFSLSFCEKSDKYLNDGELIFNGSMI